MKEKMSALEELYLGHGLLGSLPSLGKKLAAATLPVLRLSVGRQFAGAAPVSSWVNFISARSSRSASTK
jgi:hypothetical protein